MCTNLWLLRLKEREHSGDQSVDTIKIDLKMLRWMWIGFIWLSIVTDGKML
jgi:hypothetical protein